MIGHILGMTIFCIGSFLFRVTPQKRKNLRICSGRLRKSSEGVGRSMVAPSTLSSLFQHGEDFRVSKKSGSF